MALPFDVTAEDVIVARIRSRLATLRNYRSTSIKAHGRLVESVKQYESVSWNEVAELMRDHPDLSEVQRWGRKFREVVNGAEETDSEP
jgi:hypothetical protein